MFVHYRTPAFVLSKQDSGEADRIFSLYTKEFGKIRVYGKGIRKMSSKLQSHMERFSLTDIEFIQGRYYKTLVDARVRESYAGVKNHFFALSFAARMHETADVMMHEGEKDDQVWDLFVRTMPLFDQAFVQKNWNWGFLLSHYFRWNLLLAQGYAPHVASCVKCRSACDHSSCAFAPLEGGVVCNGCSAMIQWKIPFVREQLDFLRVCFSYHPHFFRRTRMEVTSMKQLERALYSYIHARDVNHAALHART